MARRKRSGGKLLGFNQEDFVGAAVVVVAEPMLDKLFGQFSSGLGGSIGVIQVDDILKLVAGNFFAKRGGAVGSGGKTLQVIAAVRIMEKLLGGLQLFPNGGNGTGTAQASSTNINLQALTQQQKRDPILRNFK